tara:strand:+ start:245 stop:508 length:264 start_codon:yes stop_codon:yes gene_type:complete
MNSLELAINSIAALSMLCVMALQGYMLGYLFTRKLLEWYDVYMIKKKVPDGLCYCGDMEENHGYGSNHAVVFAVDYGIENAKKWERG